MDGRRIGFSIEFSRVSSEPARGIQPFEKRERWGRSAGFLPLGAGLNHFGDIRGNKTKEGQFSSYFSNDQCSVREKRSRYLS